MLKLIIFAIILGVAAVLILANSKPDSFRVERSITMLAAPEKVFAFLNDFHRWAVWSPWEKLDPDMRRTFSGEAEGPGAIYEWDGNKQVGQGRMEVVESLPPDRLTIHLDFIRPFEAHNIAEFTLQQLGTSTQLTWAMYGPAPFISKIMQVFVSMDRMIGKDFETGLANLKAVAEAEGAAPGAKDS